MNDFNQRYDFNRSKGPQSAPRRLQRRLLTALILLVVLAVTGTIIYFIIPHETKEISGGDKGNGAGQKAVSTPLTDVPGATARSSAGNGTGNAATSGDPQNTGSAENDGGTNSGATGADTGNTGGRNVETSAETGVDDPLERAMNVTVRAGDTLEKIASRHYTTVEGIKHFNGLKNDTIRIGQILKIIPGPWRITVKLEQNELVLAHDPAKSGAWRLFRSFPADASGMKNVGISEFAVSFMRRHPDWINAHGSKFKYGDPENPYGDYLLMLARRGNHNNPLRGFGIHGVDDKTSNIKNCGRGCIHVGSRDIELVYYLVCPGTEVSVISGGDARNLEN